MLFWIKCGGVIVKIKSFFSILFFIAIFVLYQNCDKQMSTSGTQNGASNSNTTNDGSPSPDAPAPAPGSPSPTPTPPAPAQPAGLKSIPAGTSWYWQLQGSINVNQTAKVYDLDLFDQPKTTFDALKMSQHILICYFSAGTYEDWRPDEKQFPAASLGNGLGWPGEKWLDVRNSTVRAIMLSRLDLAKNKGCDGVEPDNVDGYANNSGFNLSKQDQINFLTFLADEAHKRGMTIALKNATDLVQSLAPKFDFAVVEECFKYNECDAYSPFVAQNKAVLNAEYSAYSATICTRAKNLQFSTVFFNLDLDGTVYRPCN